MRLESSKPVDCLTAALTAPIREVTAVEIGPGGGRWTRYLLGFKSIYAVDYHDEVLREFAKTFGFIQLASIRLWLRVNESAP